MSIYCPVAAFAVACLVLLLFLNTKFRKLAVDQPNHRSLHAKPIPRTGGLAIIAGFVTAAICLHAWHWILFLTPLLAVSLLDDVTSVSPLWRFAVQCLVAGGFVVFCIPELPIVLCAALLFCILWMINLYNFMDGSDGLAGGMALFGFGSYSIAAAYSSDSQLMALCLSLVGAIIPFLWFNFNPAKIFMGDSGSVPLGFLAAAIGIQGWINEVWPIWFPIITFSPFIIDATVTLLKRLFNGEKIWQPHRNHYYQRVVQLGWGHKKTALAEYGLMILAGATAIIALKFEGVLLPFIFLWLIVYGALIVLIDIRWNAFENKINQT